MEAEHFGVHECSITCAQRAQDTVTTVEARVYTSAPGWRSGNTKVSMTIPVLKEPQSSREETY